MRTLVDFEERDDIKSEIIVKIQRPWKLGKCFSCGNVIHVIDDFTPASCPLCHRSRVD